MGGVFVTRDSQVSAIAGLTVTPATSTLSLGTDEPQQRSNVTITNNYNTPVSLQFSFGTQQNATQRDKQAAETLAVQTPDVTLGAGQSFTQTIILSASDKLAPGSQQADLVISQFAVSGTNVGVLPELRLPLILVKEDGAITSLGVTNIATGVLSLAIPKAVEATVKNTGNMLAIPRGVVTVTAPNGTVVAQGALNVSSKALSPGASVSLSTPITRISNAVLPGPYTVQVSYGLGGDNAVKVAGKQFAFVAWWHIAIALTLIATAYYITHSVVPSWQYKRIKKKRHPEKAIMAESNTA
jgi:hypothetical protein